MPSPPAPVITQIPPRLLLEAVGIKSFVSSTEGPIFFWVDALNKTTNAVVMLAKGLGHGDLLVTLAVRYTATHAGQEHIAVPAIQAEMTDLCSVLKMNRVLAPALPRLLGSPAKPFTPEMVIPESSFWQEAKDLKAGRVRRLFGWVKQVFSRKAPQYTPPTETKTGAGHSGPSSRSESSRPLVGPLTRLEKILQQDE